MVGSRPIFGFPHRYCYIGLLVLALLEAVWVLAEGHGVAISSLWGPLKAAGAAFVGVIICRIGFSRSPGGKTLVSDPVLLRLQPRIEAFFQGMFFIVAGWCLLRLFNHLTMTVPVPYADTLLVWFDGFLPVDWNGYFRFVAETPLLVWLFDYAYTGLSLLSIVAFLGLILMNRVEQARFFAVVFTVAAIGFTTVGMFFPAKAAVHVLLDAPELLSRFPYDPGTYSVEILRNLRSGEPILFDLYNLPGLTTFPSFHTASGIILAYAYRRTLWFWPVSGYAVVMIASTPVYGGHYFIDIIVGAIAAFVLCVIFERTAMFRGVFAARKEQSTTALRGPFTIPAE